MTELPSTIDDHQATLQQTDAESSASDVLGIDQQIPRNSLALLMVAQLVVVLPHLQQLSAWIVAVGLFCGYCRTQVYRGRWGYPSNWIRGLLVVLSVVLVASQAKGAFSLEAATSLLVLAFALKLLEMKSRRDAYLVIFLSYFVIATQFLFDQALGIAIYELMATIVVTAALIGLHQWHSQVRPWASLRLASLLVLQALPLTLVCFLLFPRVSPMWTVPLPGAAQTGLSERMTPGDVASLSRSDEIAFRVVFNGSIPRQRELYWRGLVYSKFSLGTWSVDPKTKDDYLVPDRERLTDSLTADAVDLVQQRYDYDVLLQPTGRDWLFGMDVAIPKTPRIDRTADYRLQSVTPVLSVKRYGVVSHLGEQMDPQALPDAVRALQTRLPKTGNSRSRAFAQDLWAATGSVEAFADAVKQHVTSGEYFYTLQPPTLPKANSVDEFWFGTQRGFCTHYAGALVFMARAAGIPARMVGGYQGGEINPLSGHLVVRQYDAHAWAELWQPGQGWLRIDPTAAVAPQRIESGLNAALSAADRNSLPALSNMRLGEYGSFGGLLNWMDSMEHSWNLWVVGFDGNQQRGILSDLLGGLDPLRIATALLVAGGGSLGLVAIIVFWRRRPERRDPAAQLFVNLKRLGATAGIIPRAQDTPREYLQRLAKAKNLDAVQVREAIADFEYLLYNCEGTDEAAPDEGKGFKQRQSQTQTHTRRKAIARLRNQVRRWHLRLTFAGKRA